MLIAVTNLEEEEEVCVCIYVCRVCVQGVCMCVCNMYVCMHLCMYVCVYACMYG